MDLARLVSQSLDLDETTVENVLTEYTKAVVLHMVFAGPVDTIYGKLALHGGAVHVAQQNPELVRMATQGLSREELLQTLADKLMEQGNESGG
jgi:hypothetical protein